MRRQRSYNACMTHEQRLLKIAADVLGLQMKDLDLEASLLDKLGADDLDILEIIEQTEEEFKILLPQSTAENITTLQDLLDQVELADPS